MLLACGCVLEHGQVYNCPTHMAWPDKPALPPARKAPPPRRRRPWPPRKRKPPSWRKR